MSAIYNEFGFRTCLDILGVMQSLNAVGFMIHAVRNDFERRRGSQGRTDDEESRMLN